MWPYIFIMAAYCVCLLGQLFDSLTTEAAIAHGWIETNHWLAWLMSKTSVSFVTALKCGIAPAGAIPFYLYGGGWVAFVVYEVLLGLVGLYCGYVNYKRLTAANIKFM